MKHLLFQGTFIDAELLELMVPGAMVVWEVPRLKAHKLTRQAEEVGFEIRDSIKLLGSPYNYVLLRKPLSEKTVAKNVLKHGTGGMAIDISRVGTSETQGRFPANILLLHTPECVCEGVKGGSGWATSGSKASENAAMTGANYARAPKPDSFAKDGKETVADWNCSESCAVRVLGEQSGPLKSGAFHQKGLSADTTQPTGWTTGKRNEAKWGSSEGTASRFFKQFTTLPEVHDYLTNLIEPPKPLTCT